MDKLRIYGAWLKKNHATKTELWMRLFKVHAKTKGIGYREALDESLCWGWSWTRPPSRTTTCSRWARWSAG